MHSRINVHLFLITKTFFKIHNLLNKTTTGGGRGRGMGRGVLDRSVVVVFVL